jgi:hypothetical protein
VAAFEPERASHAAAAAVEHLIFEAHLVEQRVFRIHPDERLLVAVAVHESLAAHRQLGDVCASVKELRERERLLRSGVCGVLNRGRRMLSNRCRRM